jgi:hypothetical protein
LISGHSARNQSALLHERWATKFSTSIPDPLCGGSAAGKDVYPILAEFVVSGGDVVSPHWRDA